MEESIYTADSWRTEAKKLAALETEVMRAKNRKEIPDTVAWNWINANIKPLEERWKQLNKVEQENGPSEGLDRKWAALGSAITDLKFDPKNLNA